MPVRYTASVGQSNGDGADNLGHMWCDGRVSYRSDAQPLLRVWNNEPFINAPATDPKGQLGSAFVRPTKNAAPFRVNNSSGGLRTPGNNNAGIHFANYLSRGLGDNIRHFQLCRGSTTIKSWVETDGAREALYQKSAAIFDLARAGTPLCLAAMTLHFGEGDNGSGEVECFAARLKALRATLIADGYADAATLFLLCLPAPQHAASTEVMEALAAEMPSAFAVVRNAHLTLADGVHWAGDQLQYVGRIAYRTLTAHPRATSLGLRCEPLCSDTRVTARGFFDTTVPCNSWSQIPLAGDLGRVEMVQAGGYLTIPWGGIWRLAVRAGIENAAGLEVRIETSVGSPLAYLGGHQCPDPSQNTQRVTAFTPLMLGTGDTVALAIRHQRPSTVTVRGEWAFNEIGLAAEYLGPC